MMGQECCLSKIGKNKKGNNNTINKVTKIDQYSTYNIPIIALLKYKQ